MRTVKRGRTHPNRQGRAVSLWLLEEDIEKLKEIAQEKGIGHTTLIRMWVKERLTARQLKTSSQG